MFLFWIKDSSSEVQTIFFTFSGCKCLRLQVQPRFSTKYLQMLFILSYTESLHCMRRNQLLLQKHKLMFYCNSIFFFRLKTNLMESLASIRSSCRATRSSKTINIHEVRSYSTIISKYSYMGVSLQAHTPLLYVREGIRCCTVLAQSLEMFCLVLPVVFYFFSDDQVEFGKWHPSRGREYQKDFFSVWKWKKV
jgi:hypothetical protein